MGMETLRAILDAHGASATSRFQAIGMYQGLTETGLVPDAVGQPALARAMNCAVATLATKLVDVPEQHLMPETAVLISNRLAGRKLVSAAMVCQAELGIVLSNLSYYQTVPSQMHLACASMLESMPRITGVVPSTSVQRNCELLLEDLCASDELFVQFRQLPLTLLAAGVVGASVRLAYGYISETMQLLLEREYQVDCSCDVALCILQVCKPGR